MSDTTGWKRYADIWEKYIDGFWFTISKYDGKYSLRVRRMYVATRPTLRECQILAHATARLWAGETHE